MASVNPPPAPAPAANPVSAISVTFVNGSADLPSSAADQLKQLAARRGNGVIAVTGYGDATSNDPDAQAMGLTLGLSRAHAMAAALASAGVPASAMQVDAQALGRGGAARLVQ
jgi:outer membrane protein OmpA-like peptidoglycan-associated protein